MRDLSSKSDVMREPSMYRRKRELGMYLIMRNVVDSVDLDSIQTVSIRCIESDSIQVNWPRESNPR